MAHSTSPGAGVPEQEATAFLREISRRVGFALLLALAPMVVVTAASLAYHYQQAANVRYIIAFKELKIGVGLLEMTLLEARDTEPGDNKPARTAFVELLTQYSAIRAADPDREETAGTDVAGEIRRLMIAYDIDPRAAAERLGLVGHAMPEAIADIWHTPLVTEPGRTRSVSLEDLVARLLLTAEPLVTGRNVSREGLAAFSGLLGPAERETISKIAKILVAETTANQRAPMVLALMVLASAILGTIGAALVGFRPLMGRIVSFNEALREETHRAQAAERAKSDFLATMSHEIRTPMNGVIGMSRLLAQSKLDDHQTMLNEVVLQSGEQLLSVINDVLDISKVDAGKLQLAEEPFRLSRIINEPAQMQARMAEEKRLNLAVRVQPNMPRIVVGDVDRLRQVVLNLVGNAVKFTASGQVYVNASGATAVKEGAPVLNLRVEVEDTGPGIAADKLDHIFDRFTQVDGSSTRTHEGTGLGLAIAKGIVEAMGGRIGVQSKPGAGATFWFELPLPVAESVPQVKATAVNVAGKRALVVDDNETNRYIARELMRSWRMHESSASSGRECLEMLRAAAGREQPFDVVILDQQMPGLDGDATMAAIRADHAIRDTAIVMLSSLDSAIGGARADARADQYLVKPAPASALYDAIATSLSDAASRKLAAAEPVMAKAEARPKPAPAATGEPVPTRGVVLLVEDNQVNRLVAKQILAAAPIRVVEAHNGAEALDMVAVHQPDVILMDVSMPVMNGHEATRRIRERERAQQLTPTLIVGMTAHAMAGDRAKCIEAGMDDYLPKPVDGEKLLGIIEEQFHRSEVPTIDREAS